jgi:hypothetical protein
MSGEAATAEAWGQGPARSRFHEHLAHALDAAAVAVGDLTARVWKDRFGITIAEWRLMVLVAEAEAGASAEAIGRKGAERRRLRGLVGRGLAEARPEGFALTSEGRRLYGEIAPLALAYEATLVTGLSPGEVTVLKLLLTRLTAAAQRLRGETA